MEQSAREQRNDAIKEFLKRDFPYFLKSLMITAGFHDSEADISSTSFRQFLLLSITKLAWKYVRVAKNSFETFTKEESEFIKTITSKMSPSTLSANIKDALNLFKSHYPSYLQKLMVRIKVNEVDAKEPKRQYDQFFIYIFIHLCKMLCKYQTTFFASYCNEQSQEQFRKVAMKKLQNKLPKLIQSLMRQAGFSAKFCDFRNLKFQQFLFLILTQIATSIPTEIDKLSKLLKEEEKKVLKDFFLQLKGAVIEDKMKQAVKKFLPEYSKYIDDFLVKGNFNEFRTSHAKNIYEEAFSSSYLLLSRLLRKLQIKQSVRFQIPLVNGKLSALSNFAPVEYCLDLQSILLVSETKRHFTYAVTSRKGEKFAMKVVKPSSSYFTDLQCLEHEITISRKISHSLIRKPVRRVFYQSAKGVLFEWATGVPIFSEKSKFDLFSSLSLIREITSFLSSIHEENMLHLNLCNDHILFDKNNNTLKIIGLGQYSKTTVKFKSRINDIVNKDLHCISPEQANKLIQQIDYRSDFYSLGVILYKMLTGKYPFERKSDFSILQMHIAGHSIPVHEVNNDIPFILSSLVSKLMSRQPEDRYQSPKGLIHDLDLMMADLNSLGTLNHFELGQHDSSNKFLISRQMFGRSSEYNNFISFIKENTFDSMRIVLVEGDIGSGKSSLINNFYSPIIEFGGITLSGKFDRLKQQPYAAISEAISNLCNDILMRDKPFIEHCKSILLKAVGEEGKLLTHLVHNLTSLMGKQPEVSEALGNQAKMRLQYIFIEFFKAICSLESPVFLILEDLHLLDIDSGNLLNALLYEKSLKELVIIGSYRGNELKNDQPMQKFKKELEALEVHSLVIKLDNLNEESVNELISQTLHAPKFDTYSLTSFIYKKTLGNPLFVKEVISALYSDGKIFFCVDQLRWKWKITNEQGISDGIQELFRNKISSFDDDTKQALALASCLESPFSLHLLKIITSKNRGIENAIASGMIVATSRNDNSCRFYNDAIQQAARSLLPDNPSDLLFYVGKKLWTNLSLEALEDNIFDVANLLKYSVKKQFQSKESFKIADLFLKAGKKAMEITFYDKGLNYFEYGIEVLRAVSWISSYSLSLKLHDYAAKAAYCSYNEPKMEGLISQISKHITSPLHLVNSSLLQIKLLTNKTLHKEALSEGFSTLKAIGEDFESRYNCKSSTEFTSEINDLKNQIIEKGIDGICSLGKIDEVNLHKMKIFSEVMPCALMLEPTLQLKIATRMVHLTLEKGLSTFASRGFVAFGSGLARRRDKMALQCGEIAVKLLDRTNMKHELPTIFVPLYGCTSHFFSCIHDTLRPLRQAYRMSLTTGNHVALIGSSRILCGYAFLTGKPLQDVYDLIEDLSHNQFVRTINFRSLNQAVISLLDETEKGKLFSEMSVNYLRCFEHKDPPILLAQSILFFIIPCYLLQNYSMASKLLDRLESVENRLISLYHYQCFFFYKGLVSSVLARHTEQQQWLESLKFCISKLKSFAEDSAENFMNKVLILQAELSVIINDKDVMQYYKKAVTLSESNGFLHEKAIALENAGRFLNDRNEIRIAAQCMKNAYHCFKVWGASEKLKLMWSNYGSLLSHHEFSQFLEGHEKVDIVLELESNVGSLENSELSLPTCFNDRKPKRARIL